MKPRCAACVPARQYGRPGPCESMSPAKPVVVAGKKTYACRHHRERIKAGKAVELTAGIKP